MSNLSDIFTLSNEGTFIHICRLNIRGEGAKAGGGREARGREGGGSGYREWSNRSKRIRQTEAST